MQNDRVVFPVIKGIKVAVCTWISYLADYQALNYPQEDTTILIHNAAVQGELDTLKDLIEEKNVNPCLTNNVRIIISL